MKKTGMFLIIILLLSTHLAFGVLKESEKFKGTIVMGTIDLPGRSYVYSKKNKSSITLYLQNSIEKSIIELEAVYDDVIDCFLIITKSLPPGSYRMYEARVSVYQLIDKKVSLEIDSFRFNHTFEIKKDKVNNLGTADIYKEVHPEYSVDMAEFNKGFYLIRLLQLFNKNKFAGNRWHNVEVEMGDPIVKRASIFDNLQVTLLEQIEDLEVEVSYNSELTVNKSTGLVISISGDSSASVSGDSKVVGPEDIPGLKMHLTSQVTSITLKDSSVCRVLKWEYYLVFSQTGEYTIDTFTMKYNEKEYKLPPITIKVKE